MIREGESPPSLEGMPDVWEGPEFEDRVDDEVAPGLGDLYGDRSADAPGLGDLAEVQTPEPVGEAKTDEPPRSFAAIFTGHVVVPTATIAMVSALLFFLYDVRSVFLPGAGTLKWVGFCFVVATVLTARYGRAAGDDDGRTMYTFVLAVVTILAMILSPWEAPEAGWLGPLSNVVIVAVVWRFATSLTDRLSADLDAPPSRVRKIFGLARLEMERLERDPDRPISIYDLGRRARERALEREGPAADPERAGRDVVRLVLVGLGLFALGEPFLLAGPPAAGERALGAMIVFLLAAGCVLAAASSYRGVRRAWGLGARVSATGVAARVAAAALALVLVLAVALGVPGVRATGTGERVPVAMDSGVEGENGDLPTDDATLEESPDGEVASQETDGERGDGDGETSGRQTPEPRSTNPGSSFVDLFARLGSLLRWPLVALAILAALYFGIRFAGPIGTALASFLDRLRRSGQGFLDRLRARFARRRGEKGKKRVGDPLADLGTLESLEPREAVLVAYGRLLATLDALGHERAPEHTPLDVLARWPKSFVAAKAPAERLTDAYLVAAYAPDAVPNSARGDAVAALVEVRAARDGAADSAPG